MKIQQTNALLHSYWSLMSVKFSSPAGRLSCWLHILKFQCLCLSKLMFIIYLYRQLGMDESLFQRLALHRPESTVQLSLQYRMNSAIMRISNALVYEGKLQCGNEAIANAILSLPYWSSFQQVVMLNDCFTWKIILFVCFTHFTSHSQRRYNHSWISLQIFWRFHL